MSLDEIRTETVRMRGFLRAAETQATKVIALIDAEPTSPPVPDEPTPIFSEDWSAGFGQWDDQNNPGQHSIVSDPTGEDRGNVLQVDFADQNDAGWLAKWFSPPASGELHVRTAFYLDQWGAGDAVKLTNIAGNRTDDPWSSFGQAGVVPNGSDFFASMCSMGSGAQADRRMLAYTYHPSQGGVWGDEDYDTVVRPTIGAWHQLDHYVWLNDVGQANGVVRIWLDAEPVVELTGLEFRTDAALDLNMLMLSFNGFGLNGNRLFYDDVHVYDGAPMIGTVMAGGGGTTPPSDDGGSSGGGGSTSAPTVIDNVFDDGVSGSWTGAIGSTGISLISDPTGHFSSRQVARHRFSINSGSHTDQDRYRYYDGYSGQEVYAAMDYVIENVTDSTAQRKLIYFKGDRNYPPSWTVILKSYGAALYLGIDDGTGFQPEEEVATGIISEDTPYRLELGVRVNDAGSSNGWIKVWATDLSVGASDRTQLYNSTGREIDSRTGGSHDASADRIQIGDQLDNGGSEGSLVADDRIIDRMMISANEIGTWGL